jgi:hypothetical protein
MQETRTSGCTAPLLLGFLIEEQINGAQEIA